jgi:hypothetical protein
MTNTIKWQYEGTDIYFLSTEANFERHKLENTKYVNLTTTPNIIIIQNEPTTNPTVTSKHCRNCNSSTKTKSTLSVDNQTAQPTGEETSGLLNVLDILDVSNTPFVYSESGDTNLSGDLN